MEVIGYNLELALEGFVVDVNRDYGRDDHLANFAVLRVRMASQALSGYDDIDPATFLQKRFEVASTMKDTRRADSVYFSIGFHHRCTFIGKIHLVLYTIPELPSSSWHCGAQ